MLTRGTQKSRVHEHSVDQPPLDQLRPRPGRYCTKHLGVRVRVCISMILRSINTHPFIRCHELQSKITQLSDGEYAIAKNDVDRLRQELGQAPLPSLQQTLEERTTQYLTERRLNGNENGDSSTGSKRSAPNDGASQQDGGPAKRPRGRPKGSKNKKVST